MNLEGSVSSAVVAKNLVGYLCISGLDIILNAMILFADMSKGSGSGEFLPVHTDHAILDSRQYFILAIASSSVQIVLHFVLVFWYFFLVWKTFPFRFGMLKRLIWQEFPVLFWVPFNFLLFAAERGYRMAILITQDGNVITIYENWIYLIVFYTRQIFSLIIFAASLKAAIEIASPSYYKPNKWLVN